MTPEQILPYIGLPHVDGATGPEAYDCWGLLRHIQMAYFNNPLPIAPLSDYEACKALYAEQLRSGEWEPIEKPIDGAGVLLRGGRFPHVGVWLDNDGGAVLHSLEGFGVVFTPFSHLRGLGFPRVTYYRLHK